MKYTKEDKRRHLILMCRYYDGTKEDIYLKKLEAHEIDKSHLPPPECMKEEYTLSVEEVAHLKNAHTARCYEEHWVKEQLNGKKDNGCIGEYVAYGNKDFDVDDGTPISLKAVEDILTYYMNEKPYSGAVNADSGKTRMQVYREQLKEKRVASELDLNLMLMRSTRSQKVGRRGVHLTIAGEKIDYYNDELILNYFGKEMYCRYDPEDISTVRVYDLNDNYIMTVPVDNEAVLTYGSSKDAVGQALRKVRSLEKLTKQELKASQITALGKKTALEIVLAAAEENKAKAEEINPKVISVHRADETAEQLPVAVGQNNIVKIDKAKMIRNLEERQREE